MRLGGELPQCMVQDLGFQGSGLLHMYAISKVKSCAHGPFTGLSKLHDELTWHTDGPSWMQPLRC